MVSRIGSDGTRQPSPENSYQPSGKDAHCSDGRDPRSRARRVDRDDARRVVWDATQQSPARCGRFMRGIVSCLRPAARLRPRKNTSEQLEPSDPADVSRPSIAAASVGSQKAQQERHMGVASEVGGGAITPPPTHQIRYWLTLLLASSDCLGPNSVLVTLALRLSLGALAPARGTTASCGAFTTVCRGLGVHGLVVPNVSTAATG